MLDFVMLSAFILSVIKPNVIMLNVVAPILVSFLRKFIQTIIQISVGNLSPGNPC